METHLNQARKMPGSMWIYQRVTYKPIHRSHWSHWKTLRKSDKPGFAAGDSPRLRNLSRVISQGGLKKQLTAWSMSIHQYTSYVPEEPEGCAVSLRCGQKSCGLAPFFWWRGLPQGGTIFIHKNRFSTRSSNLIVCKAGNEISCNCWDIGYGSTGPLDPYRDLSPDWLAFHAVNPQKSLEHSGHIWFCWLLFIQMIFTEEQAPGTHQGYGCSCPAALLWWKQGGYIQCFRTNYHEQKNAYETTPSE